MRQYISCLFPNSNRLIGLSGLGKGAWHCFDFFNHSFFPIVYCYSMCCFWQSRKVSLSNSQFGTRDGDNRELSESLGKCIKIVGISGPFESNPPERTVFVDIYNIVKFYKHNILEKQVS